jgi:hypothetical protein
MVEEIRLPQFRNFPVVIEFPGSLEAGLHHSTAFPRTLIEARTVFPRPNLE